MNFFKSENLNPETFAYGNASCFNKLRAFFDYETFNHVGTYMVFHECDKDQEEQTERYLRKALRVIPLLSCINYSLDHHEQTGNTPPRCYHIVSVPTKRIPADKAMQALFLARYILFGTFSDDLHHFAYIRNGVLDTENKHITRYNYTPKPWFSEERMMKDNKYFAAVLFFASCFKPRKNNALFSAFLPPNAPQAGFTSLNLIRGIADSNFFSSAACSLYSVKKFYHGKYVFMQPSLHKQKGYIRDQAMQYYTNQQYTNNAEATLFRTTERKYIDDIQVFSDDAYFIDAGAPPVRALSLIMSQGEVIENFQEGSHYRIEDFLEYTLYRDQLHYCIPEEKAPLLIQRLIDIINE